MATMYQDPFGAADYSADGTRGLLEFLRDEYPRVYGAGAAGAGGLGLLSMMRDEK